jgi:glycine/D-amino acid oxidase-like deaminating enzyme
MRDAFVNRITEDDTYLNPYPDQNKFNQHFNFDFGCGQVKPVHLLNLQLLIASWKNKLFDWGAIREESFEVSLLQTGSDSVRYGDVVADKVIFCNGLRAYDYSWFQKLPFAPNKGESMVISCEGLSNEHIFKQGLVVVPLAVQHTFWVGASYQWEFEDDQPSEAFYNSTKKQLDKWLKLPYEILFHKAALRPATLERRPFVGMHPHEPRIGILNGMGTKGSSLAPFFANQLVNNIVHGLPIVPEADVARFTRILGK